ncbi:class I SAM-dependent methyltransferase [Mycolicibacterium sp. P9-64]|uniref:SAM-dependent methyltransferase n=1 Tax=Mycolicibacterium sp. P9-64 TaxID=2024612 RepID=UPI0011ED2F7B|nr:cyclopropane-fatty-acyl-phospholipid synthase family protein [Mycolicibacterium sp. P9-64]KAA0082627.1 class I SAM-dependent methyltransferase [Mycolicibacterium sp. P9-64]
MNAAGRLANLVRDGAGIDLPVRLRAWDGSEAGPLDGPVLVVRNRRALRRLLWAPGEMGLARAYVTGDIDVVGDIADGLRRVRAMSAESGLPTSTSLADRVRAVLGATRLGAVGLPPKPPASEARLSGRLHTRKRDRAAIAHHYDLSNDFYRLLLDEHMAYSSAYFTHDGQSLHDAQTAKLDLICRKLELRKGQRLLDVGCGWGSLILYAARNYGVRATGITLSAEQRAFIADRVERFGLSDLIDVRLQHYREFADPPASFDAVSSIEMGEHVGEEHYPAYVGVMNSALKPGGKLLLQQMSRRADAAPGGGPFIESYIAPDLHMRPLWQTIRFLESGGFEIRGVEAMREHYVTTVDRWLDTFEEHYDQFVALQGEEVARVWRLYLVGGRLAFEQGRMGVDQIVGSKQ